VIDASVVKDVAMRFESQFSVKTFGAALCMQDDFMIAPLASNFNESFYKLSAQIAASQWL
jgi:hypothetical protein